MSRAPYCFILSVLPTNNMRNPTATGSSANLVTLNATIWAVIVVPILAPRITPMAWDRDMRPAVTKPTSMTVVTDEDWITEVTKAPVSIPMTRLVVSLARMAFMRSPATFFKAVAICSMPNRKIARPPKSCIAMLPQLIPLSSAAARAGVAAIPRRIASATRVSSRIWEKWNGE